MYEKAQGINYVIKNKTTDANPNDTHLPKNYSYKIGVNIKSYHYDYSFRYNWINLPQNKPQIYRFDLNSFLELNDTKLVIRRKRNVQTYYLHRISGVKIEFKRLIFPLITGGIAFPFAILAVYSGVLSFWLGITTAFLGAAMCYYGYLGEHQLIIIIDNIPLTLFLEYKNDNILTFINQLNKYLLKK
jgi:hypothetical protein